MSITKNLSFPGNLIGPRGFKIEAIPPTIKIRSAGRRSCELLGIEYKPKLRRKNTK